ncbi:MAG TPA: mechanosensitive ion channel family protein [Gemmatimonadaceae bacterium]
MSVAAFALLQAPPTVLDRWTAHLPSLLLGAGPFGVLWWQWAALLVVAVVSLASGALLGQVLRALLVRVTRRTTSDLDDVLVARLSGPLRLGCTVLAAALLVPWLDLPPSAYGGAQRLLKGVLLLAFFWALWRFVDVAREFMIRTRWARSGSASRNLVPLGARVGKIAVAAIGLVAMLSLLGYPVASLIAGLGIGGLAVALAAQKTVENLFGAFSLGVDRPFCEGDFVKVEDFVGTVEAIGLRSTRFRTLDRTVITLPNGRLADMRLESFSARDRLRLATVIGLVYETTAAQMREVLAGFERVLREHPKVWPDAVVVRFSELAASSLDVQVMAWFKTSDWSEFQGIRQGVLLQFMDVVEAAGTSFAFPTTTVHVASAPVPIVASPNGS